MPRRYGEVLKLNDRYLGFQIATVQIKWKWSKIIALFFFLPSQIHVSSVEPRNALPDSEIRCLSDAELRVKVNLECFDMSNIFVANGLDFVIFCGQRTYLATSKHTAGEVRNSRCPTPIEYYIPELVLYKLFIEDILIFTHYKFYQYFEAV